MKVFDFMFVYYNDGFNFNIIDKIYLLRIINAQSIRAIPKPPNYKKLPCHNNKTNKPTHHNLFKNPVGAESISALKYKYKTQMGGYGIRPYEWFEKSWLHTNKPSHHNPFKNTVGAESISARKCEHGTQTVGYGIRPYEWFEKSWKKSKCFIQVIQKLPMQKLEKQRIIKNEVFP